MSNLGVRGYLPLEGLERGLKVQPILLKQAFHWSSPRPALIFSTPVPVPTTTVDLFSLT